MDTRKLIYFEAVARNLSFTKGAEELYISQPSITQAIQSLEEDLGVKLFNRDKNQISLTPEGHILLTRAREILKLMDHTRREVTEYDSTQNTVLRLGVPPVMGAWLIALIIKDFKKHYPTTILNLLELGSNSVMEALKKDEVDLGYVVVSKNPEEYEELGYQLLPVKEGEIKLIVSSKHKFANRKVVDFEELEGEKYVPYIDGTFLQETVYREMSKRNVNVNKIYKPTQYATILNLVAYDLGMSFVMDEDIPVVSSTENLKAISLKEPLIYKMGLIWKTEKYLPKIAREFLLYMSELKI